MRQSGSTDMIWKMGPCVLLLLVPAAPCHADEPLTLAEDGRSPYRVVIAADARQPVPAVAEDFAVHFEKITGARLPIVSDDAPMTGHEIIIGRGRRLDDLAVRIDRERLGPEGYVVRTYDDRRKGRHVLLVGGSERGTLNAVYTFLEDHLGCRWFTPEVTVIPRRPTLSLNVVDVARRPPFEARFVNARSTGDPAWAARQRLNLFSVHVAKYCLAAPGEQDIGRQWEAFVTDPRLTGVWHYAGNQVHTLAHNNLLPAVEYEKHPEYFALWEGARRKRGNPCLTNPEASEFIMKRVRERIADAPHGRITSISHGDGTRVCQCDTCSAAYAEDGATGTLMRFVNTVAADLEEDHPDILVDTLAYGWTQIPPTGVEMHRNVVVRYCPMWSCSYHAFNEGWDDVHETGCWRNTRHRTYGKLREWLAISPRVWVWYYALGRANLYPYPNLGSLNTTFKSMRDAGVTGVYVMVSTAFQLEPQRGGLAELKTYLFAKLAWNPDYDLDRGIEEFAGASYGPAASRVVAYVERINDPETYSYTPESIRERCGNTWGKNAVMGSTPGFHLPHSADFPLKPSAVAELNALLDEAEQVAAGDAAALRRLKLLRLSLQFAILRHVEEDDPAYARALAGFFATAETEGVPIPPDLKSLHASARPASSD